MTRPFAYRNFHDFQKKSYPKKLGSSLLLLINNFALIGAVMYKLSHLFFKCESMLPCFFLLWETFLHQIQYIFLFVVTSRLYTVLFTLIMMCINLTCHCSHHQLLQTLSVLHAILTVQERIALESLNGFGGGRHTWEKRGLHLLFI